MKTLKRIGLVIMVVLVGLQFFPTRTNQSTEVPTTDIILSYRAPENIENILHTSCYNCHSNNTNYPWYSHVQPVGWLLESHINKGKEELNLSEFGSYSVRRQKSKLNSMVNQIEKGEMPLYSYTLIHRDARLSQDQKKTLVNYLNSILDSLQ
ncbi:MAG: heme-binding domain-containing protein [Paludibacter sp.]|nr:heme-binding domain-containing protein [Paludibacter sp.]